MLTIQNYQILAQIYESANSLVYRALREEDNQPVILKLLKQDYPTPEELTRYRQEYDITRHLENVDGVIKAYSLEKHQNTLVMCLEDFGGESLKHWLAERTFSLEELLRLAISSADILAQIHQQNIIHKDINPANLIFNPTTGQLKIIDFGISTQFSREMPTLKNPNVLEGTLAYMSPEQTGRMNRAMDYRSDFYSLGATFYEIFTRKMPFEATDAMELVHGHIAIKPPRPVDVNPQIPGAVSDVIMKLLEKTAEARYQSAWGLKADFENCLNQLEATGQIETFRLAQFDMSARFKIPQNLYGREREIDTLLTAFEQVSQGQTQLTLVAGYSGIGKSVLVKEIYKSLTEKQGYFIAGKFDQFKRNIPYSAIANAFGELVQQLLMESESQLAQWREELLTALGPNGQVIIDVIPELERIIGKQPTVPILGPTESQNRFNFVFQNVMRVFFQQKHPFIIFLDDLQWADSATLKLLELVMTDKETGYLFLIGAYRDNEVSPTHALMMTLDKLHKEEVTVNQIHLMPLNLEHVNQLIADSLRTHRAAVQPLTELVMRKTAGNPFFVNQFLKTLYEENLLTFEVEQLGWQWDVAKIGAMNITDNVVELMIGKLKKLPKSSQHVLRLAACVGNRFDLNTLAVIHKKSTPETFQNLTPVLTEGLVLPASELEITGVNVLNSPLSISNFQFLHDRVQQAAYALIDDNQKKAVHLQIGHLLLKNTQANKSEEHLFDIVEHLNIGFELVDNQAERNEIARLNLVVGQKAKAATAYGAAVKYLEMGRELLAEDSWETEYDLTLNLYTEAVEATFLNTNFEQTHILSDNVLQQANTVLDKVKVYEIKIQYYVARNQMQAAMDTVLQALQNLGVSLSDSPPPNLPIEKIYQRPEMTNPSKLAAMRLMVIGQVAFYLGQSPLWGQVILTMVNLGIRDGNSPFAAFAYATYGFIQCAGLSDIEKGYQFGQLGLKMVEQFDAKALKCRVGEMLDAGIRHWKEPAAEAIVFLREDIQIGLENGDLEFAGYSAMFYCSNIFFIGDPLESVHQKQVHCIGLIQKIKNKFQLYYANIWGQLVLNLRGETQDKHCLTGPFFDEADLLPILREANNQMSLFSVYHAKTMLSYLFKNYEGAITNNSQATNYEQSTNGTLLFAVHLFYASLALLAHYPTVAQETQTEYLEKVAANQQKMAIWAKHAPMNFQHKYDLVEAEKARVLGQLLEAEACYEKAISGARDNGYIQEEALAHELAGLFYLAKGQTKFAQVCLREAHYAYQQWGAAAKVADLEQRYPQFLAKPVSTQVQTSITKTPAATLMGPTSLTSYSSLLDLSSVVKASQTLSGEIVLERLKIKMMQLVIENAGAEKGFLLLPQKDQWFIEAEGNVGSEEVNVLQSIPVEEHQQMAATMIHYVARTQLHLVLDNATEEEQFSRDPYIVKHRPKSVLCAPLVNQGQLTGILYLENNLTEGAFTPDRLEVLQVLSSQIAISIENALLYRTLEQKVEERTAQLAQANTQLADANQQIMGLNEQLKSENLRMSAE
ncbi:MAG: serine/threonine-protein kinase PknK, partial [Candidatus Parabeggiatoa sp. nov. 1]